MRDTPPPTMSLVVVDAGIGNLGAIPNMLKRLGAKATITSRPEEVSSADRIILPGVGAFDAAMRSLAESGMEAVLRDKALGERVPILGVCLGMQLLFGQSEEGRLPGLGWIAGRVVRFRLDGTDATLRIPHMGWNWVSSAREGGLLSGFDEVPRFYFAHSFHVECDVPDDVVGWTTYGYRFASAVQHDNIGGIQFHPEKSHRYGLKVLENFIAA